MIRKTVHTAYTLALCCTVLATVSHAGTLDLELESGAVWFSQNDTRIPGDTGTKFDMRDLTGDGPDPYIRLYATYEFNPRHALRLTYAPIEVSGTGQFTKEVIFADTSFAANTDTAGTYRFNTYRLTYRWTFHETARWRWGFGGAALIRDAEISLEQGGIKATKDDLGVVPLLHLYGAYQLNDAWSAILDIEGAWAPQGRAFDVALKARYDFDSGWYLSAGYRTLEGGADNDEVYTFAWLHYAMLTAGYRF